MPRRIPKNSRERRWKDNRTRPLRVRKGGGAGELQMSEKRSANSKFPFVTDRAETDRLLGGASRTLVIHARTKAEIDRRRKQREERDK